MFENEDQGKHPGPHFQTLEYLVPLEQRWEQATCTEYCSHGFKHST